MSLRSRPLYRPVKFMRSKRWGAKGRTMRAQKTRAVARAIRRKANRGLDVMNYRTAGYLGIERKFLDCAWNAVAVNQSTDGSGIELQPSTGCTNAISVPAQGDGESNRDGRKYTLKSAFISGHVQWDGASDQADTSTYQPVFLALVLDTQANGATIVSENVYINPSTSGLAMLPQPLRNLQNSKRFRVLDHTIVYPGGAYAFNDAAATGSINTQIGKFFKLSWRGNLICDSVGTTADIASASDNALHVLACTAATTPGTPAVYAKSRVRFVG